ncbi:MAG: hypothetical protein ACHRHE_11105 [Tepidisphaerales bacterium]
MRAIIAHPFHGVVTRRRTSRPDYTLPLRLQSSGQSAAAREGIEIRRMLWTRALADGWIWRRACVAGLLVAMIEIVLDPGGADLPPWSRVARLAMLATTAVGVAVVSAAGNRVRGAMVKRKLSSN